MSGLPPLEALDRILLVTGPAHGDKTMLADAAQRSRPPVRDAGGMSFSISDSLPRDND